MAIMKVKQIREMKNDDLSKRLNELKLELSKELSNVKMGRPIKNAGRISELRKTIARINTIVHEKKLKIRG
jgi:large subunit ribosomal protein L29